jgi:hypothetical protein
VNALAIIYVNNHLMELQAETQRKRTASLVAKRSLRQRAASATASLRSILGQGAGPVVPDLRNYPYGG